MRQQQQRACAVDAARGVAQQVERGAVEPQVFAPAGGGHFAGTEQHRVADTGRQRGDALHRDAERADAPLLAGSALFGIGWGLSGYCPGPAVASLALFSKRMPCSARMSCASASTSIRCEMGEPW